jgi:hypothetical protein
VRQFLLPVGTTIVDIGGIIMALLVLPRRI